MDINKVGSGIAPQSKSFIKWLLIVILLIIIIVYLFRRWIKTILPQGLLSPLFIEGFDTTPTYTLYPVYNASSVPTMQYDQTIFNFGNTDFDSIVQLYATRALNSEYDRLQALQDKSQQNLNISNQLLQNLNNGVSTSQAYPAALPIQTIKSLYNSQILTLMPIDTKYYLIQINDKCLTVYDDNDYTLKDCDSVSITNTSQTFYHVRINNANDAQNATGNAPLSNTLYPYSMFKSLTTDQALTSSDNGITVEPCNPDDNRQFWTISPEEYSCGTITNS